MGGSARGESGARGACACGAAIRFGASEKPVFRELIAMERNES